MYLPELRQEVSQGDIFASLPLLSVAEMPENEGQVFQLRNSLALLLTHDCEYDKPTNLWVLAAEVRLLSEVPTGSQGHIRQYLTRNTFYLEAIAGRMLECYVDFRCLTQISKSALSSSAATENRIASLNDEARLALQRQVAIFFGYGR